MDDRIPSLGIYTACLAILLLALVVKPSPKRWTLFLPIATLSGYILFFTSTGNYTRDDIVGSLMLTYLFTASDYILLTDVQHEFRTVGQREPIFHEPFWSRFRWGLRLFISPRGVGWEHQPRANIPPPPLSKSRFSFTVSQCCSATFYFLVLDVAGIFNRWNLGCARRGECWTHIGWLWRVRVLVGFIGSAVAGMNILFCLISTLSVVVGASEPKDWPPFFGNWLEAYTLRRFWSRTWHQLLRRVLSSHSKAIAHRLLRLPPGTVLSAYVQLWSAFLISGMIHHGGEYMMLKHWGGSGMWFFLVQPVAMTVEDWVLRLASGMKTEKVVAPNLFCRLLGYVWVFVWFVYVLDPVISAQMMEEGFHFSVLLGAWSGNWQPRIY